MSALPYQPVPTIAQRKALHADHAKRYARQYRDNQDEAIGDFRVVQLRYVERAAGESCCGAEVDEDESTEFPLPIFAAICIGALGLWCAIGYATWWLVGLFTGVKA
jgi:hypothetical protein